MAVEMHSLLSKQGVSKESRYIMGSPWTLLRSGRDCAFCSVCVLSWERRQNWVGVTMR